MAASELPSIPIEGIPIEGIPIEDSYGCPGRVAQPLSYQLFL
jgi:hypothetical protein